MRRQASRDRVSIVAPLCACTDISPSRGEHQPSRLPLPASTVHSSGRRAKPLISPLVGEMAGRPEGGDVEPLASRHVHRLAARGMALVHDHLHPLHLRRSPLRRPMGAGGGGAARNPRATAPSAASAGRCRPNTRSTSRSSPASRSTSRRNWCCRPGPARRSPRSRSCLPTTARSSPSSRWITVRCSAARRAGHDRRRAGRQSLRPAPHQGGRRARPHPRHPRRLRPRRGLQVGRPGGEERHRLRSVEADGRLVGHAGGADRRDLQGAARRRDRDDAGARRPADEDAAAAMALAMGSSAEVSGAAHLPEGIAGRDRPAECSAAIRRRCCASKASGRRSPIASRQLKDLLKDAGRSTRSPANGRSALWRDIRDCAPFADGTEKPVWRVSMPPREAPPDGAWRCAWKQRPTPSTTGRAGWSGCAWTASPRPRRCAGWSRQFGGGHATLVRASPRLARVACPSSSRSRRRSPRSRRG